MRRERRKIRVELAARARVSGVGWCGSCSGHAVGGSSSTRGERKAGPLSVHFRWRGQSLRRGTGCARTGQGFERLPVNAAMAIVDAVCNPGVKGGKRMTDVRRATMSSFERGRARRDCRKLQRRRTTGAQIRSDLRIVE